MSYIRDRNLKKGGIRYQAEICLKGHPRRAAMFDRKTDAKIWIQKEEAKIRCDRQQLYLKVKKHTFKEAVERYFKEQVVSVVKRGHLLWWQKEMGKLYL